MLRSFDVGYLNKPRETSAVITELQYIYEERLLREGKFSDIQAALPFMIKLEKA